MARAPATEAEEYPEADRLLPFPHPRATRRLIGHDDVERSFAATFAAKRMHHAWLLAGPEGIGKATLAYRIARFLLAKPEERDQADLSLAVPDNSTAARQVLALSHPGLLLIRRTYDPKGKRFAASISVDEVRRLREFLTRTADAGSWRAVIVDAAEDLNTNAANALLKSLEEPPHRTVFLIVAAEPGRLLPTIRSRCRLLSLGALAGDDLRAAVAATLDAGGVAHPAKEDWPRLERLSAGSVRRFVQLASTGGLKLYEQVLSLVGALPRVDWAHAYALAEEAGAYGADAKIEAVFEHLLDLLSRLIRTGATGEGEAGELELAQRLISPGTIAAWAELWETIGREKSTALALNLDRKALVIDTIMRLEAIARR